MNMHAPITAAHPLTRTEVAGLVSLAARTVPPMWPLESAIAVNPLAGFEDRPFNDAVAAAAQRFGARSSLPLVSWRALQAEGRLDERSLRDAAIAHLGGTYCAWANVAPGVTKLDLLLARLSDIAPSDAPERPARLSPAAAFLAKWCGAFFDHGVAGLAMPHRELGLYRAVLALADHDPEFAALTGDEGRLLLMTVPRDPQEAIAEALAEQGEGWNDDHVALLAGLVARLPGWAGHIRWRSEHADADLVAGAPADMADLIALWLLLVRAGAADITPPVVPQNSAAEALADHFAITPATLDTRRRAHFDAIAGMDEGDLGAIFMQAAEWHHANTLVPQLQAAVRTAADRESWTNAQLVFCIDVRSEPFRRALEAQGPYQTLGYAGFFGLPMALHPHDGERRKRLLPVLLGPQHDLAESAKPGHEDEAQALTDTVVRRAEGAALFAAAKSGSSTAFATAEATGPFAALSLAARTLAPRLSDRARKAREARRAEALHPAVDGCAGHDGFSLAEKIGYAAALFRLTGLRADTARLVVLTGHGGSAVNNPYAAALDCGACGGHAGGANARVLAAMLNDGAVREGLAGEGLTIPEDTLFLAAEHNTTTDEVTIFDRAQVPPSHRAELARLEADLAAAGKANRETRAVKLGRTADDLLTGASHWGEVRPEWGLANNASFVVGPRWLTRAADLDGRSFLHSYDWQQDESGAALATILTAPMIVAQWINCQYLFSTVDNQRYGAGDKVTQNVVGGIGVVQGNGGDLKVGLPRQSLFTDDGRPYHTPQRLLTVVLAPFERVEAIIAANDILDRLFGNGWVQLVVIDPETGKARRWRQAASPMPEGASPNAISC